MFMMRVLVTFKMHVKCDTFSHVIWCSLSRPQEEENEHEIVVTNAATNGSRSVI